MTRQSMTLLLRRKQVCQALNISASTLDRIHRNPKANFPAAVYSGNKILGWMLEDLKVWLEKQKGNRYE